MTPAISVAGLSRRYRGQLALNDVTLDVEGGSITGLLGRNGAGKTTFMRIVAGKTTFMRIVAGHEFASAGSRSCCWPAAMPPCAASPSDPASCRQCGR